MEGCERGVEGWEGVISVDGGVCRGVPVYGGVFQWVEGVVSVDGWEGVVHYD